MDCAVTAPSVIVKTPLPPFEPTRSSLTPEINAGADIQRALRLRISRKRTHAVADDDVAAATRDATKDIHRCRTACVVADRDSVVAGIHLAVGIDRECAIAAQAGKESHANTHLDVIGREIENVGIRRTRAIAEIEHPRAPIDADPEATQGRARSPAQSCSHP